ncbi:putative disease resistance protein RGA3 [Papaver somniferum]|uniref:putative disease resistance protein RGA3 n=1 Tax=Papaver somniferum TaxID=3469 RepID=UPI000E6F5916|nr:putative disease resistance protein RGA3 [Papaver somniferum]
MSTGEGILTNGATETLNKLVHVVAQEINLAWGVKDELKKLQDTLEMILAVISDAGRRQVTEEAVGLWLRRLKELSYDADDMMDEFSYETMRRSVRGNNMKKKVSVANYASSNTSISYGESSTEQRSRQTESSIDESSIMGREDDKEKIINLLIPSSEKVSVVSMVGMGGLGKTTLAQLVYNDKLVNEQFNLKMWVHVSEYFDVEKLLTKIMESATQSTFDSLSNFDVLASKVREQLNGKKYLLVLDDLWNESDEQWERLCSPLLVGAQGSKILITTRKTQVADVVKGHIPLYKLGKLQDNECWSIIEKKAFSPVERKRQERR